jgi:hypothetical protein
MSQVWKFLTKPIFTLPSWLCPAVLALAVAVYVGYRGALIATYRYQDSRQFASLSPEQARELRLRVRCLSQLEISGILAPTDDRHLAQQIQWTRELRRTAPADLAGVVDLQQATNYLLLGRVEEQTKPGDAAAHIAAARTILQSLGWTEVSDESLLAFAERQMKWKPPARKNEHR